MRGRRGARRRPRLVGRGPGRHVPLDSSAFASLEDAEILHVGKAYRTSKRDRRRAGARIAWRPLDDGEEALLRPGDVIGVGRGFLVFRRD